MFTPIDSNNKKFCIDVTIDTPTAKRFRVMAMDNCGGNVKFSRRSKYVDRTIKVDKNRTITLSFPVTPKKMIFCIQNVDAPNDREFKCKLEQKPLKEWAIWMDEETKSFMQLNCTFCQTAGFKKPAVDGRPWHSSDGLFTIKYFPVIRDYMTGAALSTPARIGHSTGIIENSAAKMVPMTIPQRIAVDTHEYSHKYRNPKMGLPIEDEVGADINSAYIYLGMGFSKVDLIYVYANIFLKAQTPGNINRMRKLMDYIQRFENGEFAQRQ